MKLKKLTTVKEISGFGGQKRKIATKQPNNDNNKKKIITQKNPQTQKHPNP